MIKQCCIIPYLTGLTCPADLHGQMIVHVLDLVSQVRDVVLMNVYLDLGNPRGPGF
jgi:hypothetical protein